MTKLEFAYCPRCGIKVKEGLLVTGDTCDSCGKIVPSKEEYIALKLNTLREIKECKDTEIMHINADVLLAGILTDIGMEKIANEFNILTKYYS